MVVKAVERIGRGRTNSSEGTTMGVGNLTFTFVILGVKIFGQRQEKEDKGLTQWVWRFLL